MSAPNLRLPSNPRYQPSSLVPIFGYDNLYIPVADVEIATLQTLGEMGIIPGEEIALLTDEVIGKLRGMTTTIVDDLERRETKHDIRAWVKIAVAQALPRELHRWIHVPLTSYDPLDTGRILQFVRAHELVVSPSAKRVILLLAEKVEEYAGALQIGRTHGQHALPITVGFWLATILSRIVTNAEAADTAAMSLVGKISGAVGAHNAQIAFKFTLKKGDDRLGSFEARVLEKLGLRPVLISTQILPPEPLAYYLFACTMFSASLGQFGRDSRNLMRTEIAEICEPFAEGQVGSSTMAAKRNPINFENLEGTWIKTKNEFGKVIDTLISEHQRDLVGSSVMRDFPIIVVNLVSQLETLLRGEKEGAPFLARIGVDRIACQENFALREREIMAEPLYIALQMAGYEGDAHEIVNRRATPLAQLKGISVVEAVRFIAEEDPILQRALDGIPEDFRFILNHPECYTGDAEERAFTVASRAREYARS